MGASSSLLDGYKVGMAGLMMRGIARGSVCGGMMNLWYGGFHFSLRPDTGIATTILSLAYDLSHRLADVVFLSMFGTQMLTMLTRCKKRFHVEFGGGHRPPRPCRRGPRSRPVASRGGSGAADVFRAAPTPSAEGHGRTGTVTSKKKFSGPRIIY